MESPDDNPHDESGELPEDLLLRKENVIKFFSTHLKPFIEEWYESCTNPVDESVTVTVKPNTLEITIILYDVRAEFLEINVFQDPDSFTVPNPEREVILSMRGYVEGEANENDRTYVKDVLYEDIEEEVQWLAQNIEKTN